MSHIVQITTQVKDPAAVRLACKRLGLNEPVQGTFKLFSASATGLGVQLPAWRYPVVCETASGSIAYDNFEGRWGDTQHLNAFLQRYAVEKACLEARKQGYSTSEQLLPNGAIKVLVEVGGAH